MTTTDKLLEIFRRACKPPTELERIEANLEAALDCARDESRSESERIRELKTRIELMGEDF